MADFSIKYFTALESCLPPGKIWRDTWILDLLKGTSNFLQRIEDYARQIFVTEMVDRVSTYKDVWGKILEIENPNAAKIRGKLSSTADQSLGAYEQLLGQISSVPLKIEFIPLARCGMTCGSYLADDPWKYTVIVSGVNPEEIETIKETIDRIGHAHLNFLYFEDNEWTS